MMRTVPAHIPEAFAASNVGTWQTGQSVHHYIVDEAAAALFGLDAAKAAEGFLLMNFLKAIHPGDRKLFRDRIGRSIEHGGLFVMEYRTTPRPNEVRWVLGRGRYERNPATGEMQGRGILIDITESKLDGHVDDRALFIAPDAGGSPLERAATLALEAREAIEKIEDRERLVLLRAIDPLLWALGRVLARHATGARD
jgi:hypothetical protein